MGNSGKITKMVIEGYKDPEMQKKEGEYTLQINPENYSTKVSYPNGQGSKLANSDKDDKINLLDPEVLNITFYLDSTGVVPGCTNVSASIKDFKKLCVDVNGSIHAPNYLKVVWGEIIFPCRLKNLNIKYLMFNSDGFPIRAELEVGFEEFIDAAKKAKEDGKQSPDMTHVKTVVAGDNLPSMCEDVYGDSKYYLQIAGINNLINFRNLTPGQKLVFPRVQK